MKYAIYKNLTNRVLSATLGNGAEISIHPGKDGKLDPENVITKRWLKHQLIEFVRVPEKKKAIAPKPTTKAKEVKQ